ncbi:helix-turn-helix domain-containing protein [Solwaraspora sp. WMMD1047]|uniref:helix-turn-helix domain-containing protein n=1 Tax=Solwaraspora sp. WMMD1047 TaxID=3016102 RepID=UPI00241738C6|nr:helix-turn-helix domain-containing protein [Solwaraspora sp. WMMD1047]MDG4833906.1 helix-turn-helix domain-containing protein [Solwaraspora sp. WMMD1047]
MPGGRLTHEDRSQIAAWLADGLGYAEIGRRLGRPTSTISREVARNGTPGAYLPGHAQQAAGHRARRRKPRPSEATTDQQAAEVVRGFVDQFATLLAATGLPRMTARVFVSLLIADASGLTSAELVHRLQVSPASVSKSIRYLEAMDLVVRRPDAGGRRERYVIDDDVWLRAWQSDTSAHGEIAVAAQQGIEIFGADTTAGARLGRMGQFFARLSRQMSGSMLAEPVVHDALTVLAALVHAGRPLTLTTLATALDWPRDRLTAALDAIHLHPAIADPLVLRTIAPQTYTITTGPDRLSPAQRQALEEVSHTRHGASRPEQTAPTSARGGQVGTA